jgi:hypothetical protein
MSALCLYSCGNYTDEEDGVCRKCKGMSNAAKILDRIKIEEDDKNIGARCPRPSQTNGGAKLTKDHCSIDGCGKPTLKKGLCYKHLVEQHGGDALPPSMRKKYTGAGTKIVGGGKVKKQAEVKDQVKKKEPPSHPDTHDFIKMIEGLIIGEVESRIRPLLADLRKSIDELQEMPVGEVLTKLAMMRDDIDEWEEKHAA